MRKRFLRTTKIITGVLVIGTELCFPLPSWCYMFINKTPLSIDLTAHYNAISPPGTCPTVSPHCVDRHLSLGHGDHPITMTPECIQWFATYTHALYPACLFFYEAEVSKSEEENSTLARASTAHLNITQLQTFMTNGRMMFAKVGGDYQMVIR